MNKISLNCNIIIFKRNNQYGVLAADYLTDVDILGSYDSSTKKQSRVPYLDTNETDQKAKEAYYKNLERGWKIIYEGERNWG